MAGTLVWQLVGTPRWILSLWLRWEPGSPNERRCTAAPVLSVRALLVLAIRLRNFWQLLAGPRNGVPPLSSDQLLTSFGGSGDVDAIMAEGRRLRVRVDWSRTGRRRHLWPRRRASGLGAVPRHARGPKCVDKDVFVRDDPRCLR